MTVSNVLWDRRGVAEATRASVKDAIAALGYVPNIAAHSLAGTSPLRIGVHFGDAQHSFLTSLILGAVDATSRLGAQMLVEKWNVKRTGAAYAALVRLVRSGAQGILIAPPFGERLTAAEVAGLGDVALATLSPGAPLTSISSVRIDDRRAALEMTEHLIELGHVRIAHIRGPAAHLSSVARYEGYCAALTQAGLPLDPDLVVNGAFTFESGLAAMDALLHTTPWPTAVFAANDDMAAGAIAIARSRNIAIPDQMSIAGFDDSAFAAGVFPTLTTIHQPVSRMAERAVEHLVEKVLAGPDAMRTLESHLTPHTLIQRASTGPAPVRENAHQSPNPRA